MPTTYRPFTSASWDDERCEWFALCANVATLTRPHPILGDVPICERCNSKMDRIGNGVPND